MVAMTADPMDMTHDYSRHTVVLLFQDLEVDIAVTYKFGNLF